MTFIKVKPVLIRNIGEQMRDMNYLVEVEKEFWKENKYLACACDKAANTINHLIKDEVENTSIQLITRTIYLMVYQTLKQQQICDELNDA